MGKKDQVQLERAVDDLRRGIAVVVLDNKGGKRLVSSPEACSLALHESLDRYVLLNRRRANFFSPGELKESVRVLIDRKTDVEAIMSLACSNMRRCGWECQEGDFFDLTLLKLMKHGGLLPCALVSNLAGKHFKIEELYRDLGFSPIVITTEEIERALNDDEVVMVCSSPITLKKNQDAEIVVYRHKGRDHLAIIIGKPGKNPLVRIHSSCYTGDILRVLTCDCGDQLRATIDMMIEARGGIIVYLNQEGRDIGLVNKFRAYYMQSSHHMDTITANEILGFEVDERDFGLAAEILAKLAVKELRLVTNNPSKLLALEKRGLEVTERVKLICQYNMHNEDYINTKFTKLGHLD